MTIKECIDIVDNAKPNQYTVKEKVMWLSFIDEKLINEVLKTHEGYDGRYDNFEGYSEDKLSVVLIARSPYDKMYPEYLKMQIDRENGEMARYNNSASIFNSYLLEYRKWYNKTHMPLDSSKMKPFSPAPNNVNSGLTDAEYENLKKDMTYILTEYFNDAVSEDKLNDAVTKYIQNNREAFKGKDGKTPVKGIDYFTEEELNSIHSKCEDKIVNSAKALTDHLDDEMSRRLYLKEDTINKVDAFGDAEDKFKSYPSVFGVEAYGEELKSEIKNHYDIILDDKEDKSNMVQQMGADAPSDTKHYPSVAAVANEISNAVAYLESQMPKTINSLDDDTSASNPIHYAENAHSCGYDLDGVKLTSRYLQREWQIIGRAEITKDDQDAGKTELKAMAINNLELDEFVELMAYINIPANKLNSEAHHWHVGLSADTTTTPNSGNELLSNMTGVTASKLSATTQNILLVHSIFVGGSHLLSDFTNCLSGGYKSNKFSGASAYYDANNYPTKLEGKHAYWFMTDGYKLPTGTELILYAR